jgi:hypothetical protein
MPFRQPSIFLNKSLIIAVISLTLITSIYSIVFINNYYNDQIGFKINVKVYIDNKLITNTNKDLATIGLINYFFCKIFNASNSCGNQANTPSCTTYLSTGFTFYSKSSCSLTGMALSTQTTLPFSNSLIQSSTCSGDSSTSSGLAWKKGTISYGTFSTSITLTSTWTYTGSSSISLASVCIFAIDDKTNLANGQSTNAGTTSFIACLHTTTIDYTNNVQTCDTVTLQPNQSITVSWTLALTPPNT